jgi:hypothetical protein
LACAKPITCSQILCGYVTRGRREGQEKRKNPDDEASLTALMSDDEPNGAEKKLKSSLRKMNQFAFDGLRMQYQPFRLLYNLPEQVCLSLNQTVLQTILLSNEVPLFTAA